MQPKSIISQVIKLYPTTSNKKIAKKLNLTPSQVRTIANQNGVEKCRLYKERLKNDLIINRRKWYEESIPDFSPTKIQEQIILGSLLGDGGISKGGKRSINYYYQEHFGDSQKEYRQWKLSKMNGLNFNINGNYLRSGSHPYFTNLHRVLYPNSVKRLTSKYLLKCNHPIFLTSLYLDDGSLTVSYHYNKKKHTVYCHPSIILYTLNFTKSENELLANHLNRTFGIQFVVSSHPDGHRNLLKINKEKEVRNLLNVIKPYVKDIPSMRYKTCINENINLKTNDIIEKFGKDIKIKISSSTRRKIYSSHEIDIIIKLKSEGYTDNDIANHIGRTYWSVVYKISELRKKGLI